MYPSTQARQISVLLRISKEVDVVGDVSVTVDSPSELLAWADLLPAPAVSAWRASDSAGRYVQVSAPYARSPVHGRVTAVLLGEEHRRFWDELVAGDDLDPGRRRVLTVSDLANAWSAMPVVAEELAGELDDEAG